MRVAEQTADMDKFLQWYSAKRQRRAGRPPSGKTLQTLASRVRTCVRVAGVEGVPGLGTIMGDRVAITNLLDATAARVGSGSLRGTVDSLTSFGAYAVAMGWADSVAVTPQDRPRYVPVRNITVYPDGDVDLMLKVAAVRDLRWWAFLTTLADSWRRVGEVLALEWDWLNLTAETPHFVLPTTKSGKTNYVPLTKRLAVEVFSPENVVALKATRPVRGEWHRDPAVYVFPWSYQVVQGRMQTFCKSIDVSYQGFHSLRHRGITNALAAGVPVQAVSMLAGHESIQQTITTYHHASALSYAKYRE